jgi:sulfate-transporting ATPase
MKTELEWARSNPKARQAKSKARLARYEEMASVEYQRRNETQEIFIPPGERLGDKVIEFHGVSKAFGDKLLMDNVSFSIPPGAIVGIIGPNGAGKSTLFKMIEGRDKPDSGTVEIGATVKIAAVDQTREGLANDKTVFDAISPTAPTSSPSAASRCPAAPTSAASTSRAATSRRSSATCRAASAGACTWPRP